MAAPIKNQSGRRRFITCLFRILIFSYGCIAAMAYFFSDNLIFPYKECSYSPSLPGIILLEADDQTSVAARHWKKNGSKTLVILFHGNFEDLGQLDHIAKSIMNLGFSVLSMDYRGYGLSEGMPNEKNCYSDARLLLQQAHNMGYRDNEIILWGRSLGSGPATQLATEINARALVLESPFVTAFRTLTQIPVLPFDKFNNLSKIHKVTSPLLIFHGKRDSIIPAWHSSRLIEKHSGKNTLCLVANAGHNDLWTKDLGHVFSQLTLILGR